VGSQVIYDMCLPVLLVIYFMLAYLECTMIVQEMLRVELLWLQPQLRILVALNKHT
jgi:hypothetical protein